MELFRFMAANLLQVGHTFLQDGESPSGVEYFFFVDRFSSHGQVSQGSRDDAL
jgi:hypothetical protein